jgi:hypothetical protein
MHYKKSNVLLKVLNNNQKATATSFYPPRLTGAGAYVNGGTELNAPNHYQSLEEELQNTSQNAASL